MTIEQLRNVPQARPFRAFTIHLADGRTVDVDDPEFLTPSPSGRTFIVTHGDDAFEAIDLPLVASVKVRSIQRRTCRRKRSARHSQTM